MILSFRRRRRRGRTGEHGFTLLEMLVVLGIIALVTTLVGPRVVQYLGRAKTDTARTQIQSLGTALDLFRLDNGRYPTAQEGLSALVARPGSLGSWNGPYLSQKVVPPDPWGRDYTYRQPGQHGPFDLFTLGADGASGGDGENRDVVNW